MVAAVDVVEVAAAVMVVEDGAETKLSPNPQAVAVQAALASPGTRAPHTQIFRQGRGKGARCTSNSGKGHTFVLSLQPAPGKMCSLQDLKNETGTSSAPHIH